MGADVAGEIAQLHLPLALRRRPFQHAVLQFVREVDRFNLLIQPDGGDTQKRIVMEFVLRRVVFVELIGEQVHLVFQNGRVRLLHSVQADLAALHRKALVQQPLPPQLIRRLFGFTGGKAGGEMLVVQDPDAHTPLFGLVEQDRHIPPPGLLAEALVGPRLHAEGADVGVVDGLHHLAINVLGLAVYPQKGKDTAVKHVVHKR